MLNLSTFLYHKGDLSSVESFARRSLEGYASRNMTKEVEGGVGQLTHILRAQNKMEEASAIEEQYIPSNEGRRSVEITEQQQMKVVMVLSMLEEMGVEGKSFDDVLRSLVANNWQENQAWDLFFDFLIHAFLMLAAHYVSIRQLHIVYICNVRVGYPVH